MILTVNGSSSGQPGLPEALGLAERERESPYSRSLTLQLRRSRADLQQRALPGQLLQPNLVFQGPPPTPIPFPSPTESTRSTRHFSAATATWNSQEGPADSPEDWLPTGPKLVLTVPCECLWGLGAGRSRVSLSSSWGLSLPIWAMG